MSESPAAIPPFALLDPLIQEQLYRMNWRTLRPLQEDAIRAVIGANSHVLLAAPTAGGKTEAAFLPILSAIASDCQDGVRALYVSPLKALINDQFRRLEELCQLASIPVHKWHGDVSAAAKKELRERPSGVLLITPESMESLFLNHTSHLRRMFGLLSFVVVDELHAFLGTERGAHLRSLLCRLRHHALGNFRLLGLSATMGGESGLESARDWLRLGGDVDVKTIEAGASEKRLKYQVRGYLRPAEEEKSREKAIATDDSSGTPEDAGQEDPHLLEDLYRLFREKTALVFANNKAQLEYYVDLLGRHCKRQGVWNPFRVHHGSLSKCEREETEDALRSNRPTVAFCSSTLELGIDVGAVGVVGQLGAPWSVSSLTQRLGRGGRAEDEAREMRLFVEESEPGPKTTLIDRLFPELIRAIAMSELLLDSWSEPPPTHRLHASTMIQQVLSVIAERGGARAEEMFEALVKHGPFAGVSPKFFANVLRDLAEQDLLEQAPTGELILGLKGERIVRGRDFYAAFQTAREFAVLHGSTPIGSIALFPSTEVQDHLILAGRRWRVLEILPEQDLILVEPAKGGKLPRFANSGGPDIHPLVVRKMRDVLLTEQLIAYLDARAREMLHGARRVARSAELETQSLVRDGKSALWFTWTGTRIQRTLLALAESASGLQGADEGVALRFEVVRDQELLDVFRSALRRPPSADELAEHIRRPFLEKYEPCLSKALLHRVLGQNCLDLPGAVEFLEAVFHG